MVAWLVSDANYLAHYERVYESLDQLWLSAVLFEADLFGIEYE